MTETTSKRIAQWPTLRGATLVVSLQEPVPGERFVDIRRWYGPDEADLQPGLQGITLTAGELPDLRRALAELGLGEAPAMAGAEPAAEPASPAPVEPVEPVRPVAVASPGNGAQTAPEPAAGVRPVPADESRPAPVPARRQGIARIWK